MLHHFKSGSQLAVGLVISINLDVQQAFLARLISNIRCRILAARYAVDLVQCVAGNGTILTVNFDFNIGAIERNTVNLQSLTTSSVASIS
jgi:hypothetical protein